VLRRQVARGRYEPVDRAGSTYQVPKSLCVFPVADLGRLVAYHGVCVNAAQISAYPLALADIGVISTV